ncbi:hypothetical protein TIFTF001_047654 [Ficus carica]|uniref:Peptidase S8/S53 domain-containing protein n=1 Tax=Ficus carica TaxID=3494 RepID=A0AA88CKD2_FICCA|nr:hypothetical protein TIFTF001_047654 [Ficus carica]
MPPIPTRWKGVCQNGELFNSANCNKKIIGARWLAKGYIEARNINISQEGDILSARDTFGHGSHVASTAAGNFVKNVNYKGLATGLARGGAPLAHLAIYKAMWGEGSGTASDTLKAFDLAIHDGVDIISASIGNDVPFPLYNDPEDFVSIGSFRATANGITVVASAGNSGPASQTVGNTAPWIISVAATTIDRAFPAGIALGNNHTFWGQAIYFGKTNHVSAVLTHSGHILADTATSTVCAPGNLNSTLAKGKIVLCFSLPTEPGLSSASEAVRKAGGLGIIYGQPHSDGSEPCIIPCVKVDYTTATQILNYIASARSPTAKLSYASTSIGKLTSPRVASFSSRGPSSLTPEPDVAAPGVDILAAYPGGVYEFSSGTSMSCPHISGIVALIKSVHKDWSPAVIRSALVTTASQVGTDGSHIYAEGPNRKVADPFDIGGGQVNPDKVLDPGLVYKLDQYGCGSGRAIHN